MSYDQFSLLVAFIHLIDIVEKVEIINNNIDKEYKDYNVRNTFQSASNLVLKENYLKFNYQVYKQNKCVSMESPTSNSALEWKIKLLKILI